MFHKGLCSGTSLFLTYEKNTTPETLTIWKYPIKCPFHQCQWHLSENNNKKQQPQQQEYTILSNVHIHISRYKPLIVLCSGPQPERILHFLFCAAVLLLLWNKLQQKGLLLWARRRRAESGNERIERNYNLFRYIYIYVGIVVFFTLQCPGHVPRKCLRLELISQNVCDGG